MTRIKTEDVEAVARAMCDAVNADKSRIVQWDWLHREERALYETMAEAALSATPIERLREENARWERQDGRVREAMFVLSDRMRASGILSASDAVHKAYEAVVAALTPSVDET